MLTFTLWAEWDDFSTLSGTNFMDILSCREAAEQHGLDYDDRYSLVSNKINKKIEFDVDTEIDKFIIESGRQGKRINWDELAKIYQKNGGIVKVNSNSFEDDTDVDFPKGCPVCCNEAADEWKKENNKTT